MSCALLPAARIRSRRLVQTAISSPYRTYTQPSRNDDKPSSSKPQHANDDQDHPPTAPPRKTSTRRLGVHTWASFLSFAGIFTLVVTMMDTNPTPTQKPPPQPQSDWGTFDPFEAAQLEPPDSPPDTPNDPSSPHPRQPDVFNRHIQHRTPWVLKRMSEAEVMQATRDQQPPTRQQKGASRAAARKQQADVRQRQEREMDRFNDARGLAGRYGEEGRGRVQERGVPSVRARSHSAMSAASMSSFDDDFSSVGGD